MRFNGIAVVLLVAFGVTGPALAQNGALLPAEMPPADYSGNQYSDSRGCLFIRASFDGQVTWVPRFDGNRQPICTTPPAASASASTPAPANPRPATTTPPRNTPGTGIATAGTAATGTATARTPDSVPAIAPQRIGQTASVPQPAPPPRRAGIPRQTARPALPAGHNAACPAFSPFGELVRRPSGEVAVRCVTSASLMLNPPAGAIAMPDLPTVALTNTATPPPVVRLPTVALEPVRPRPVRMEPVALEPVALTLVPLTTVPLTTPRARQARAHAGTPAATFVQVATFGVPQNAARTRATLLARGLPARLHPVRAHGRPMQVVLAGPFFDPIATRDAMRTARHMGFADAFIRR